MEGQAPAPPEYSGKAKGKTARKGKGSAGLRNACSGLSDKKRQGEIALIKKIEYFCKVARYGSISRAAEQIHIAQPALSAAIHRLENELGVTLFVRAAKGVHLTKTGQKLLPYAEAICSNYESLLQEIRISKTGAGILRIGGAMQHVSQIVDMYMADSGNSNLFYRQYLNYYDIKSDLINHSVDIVVSSPPITKEGIKSLILYNETLGVLLSERNRLSAKETISVWDLQSQYLIGQPPNFPTTIAIARCMDRLGISLNFHIEAENNAIFDLLRSEHASNYAAIYPKYRGKMITREYPSIRWCPIDSEGMTRDIGVSWRKEMSISGPAREFIQFCQRFYRDEFLREENGTPPNQSPAERV